MTRVIAGNWKMNHGPGATEAFLDRFLAAVRTEALEGIELLLFPPAISLGVACRALPAGAPLAIGAQNVHPAASGAFTGETSAEMAAEVGATHLLVGHSERRHLFGETLALTHEKVAAARRAELVPVLCVGETREERREGRLEAVLLAQLDAVLEGEEMRAVGEGAPFLLAYEPVWAIGTGDTATPADASDAHGRLRAALRDRVGPDRARTIPILYGGSVNPENAEELLNAPEVDGVLVGGASLDPDSFLGIVRAARSS